jgi:heterodisulfide reductase subunit C2
MDSCTPSGTLSTMIDAGCRENPHRCYQCKRCTAGCPVAGYADMHPAQIIRAVQLGQQDLIFEDKFIWLCTGCETCTTRCPQGIDIAAIMDELRIIARVEGKVRADAPFAGVLRLNYDSIRRWGRLYEIELLARDKLTRPRSLLDDVGMGAKMLAKGKLHVLPERGDTMAVRRMVATAESITAARRRKVAGP